MNQLPFLIARVLSLALVLLALPACQARPVETPVVVATGFTPTVPLPATVPAAAGMSDQEIEILSSLEQVADYPLYTLRYPGKYLSVDLSTAGGTAATGEQPVRPAWGCSLFAALASPEGAVFGRNFDWQYSPAVLLFTNPPSGFASVSMVDIAYLFDRDQMEHLADLPIEELRPLLEAPHWPFDGMNEHGLVIAMAAVPDGQMQPDPNKDTIDSLGVMRQVLDHARNVGEAVAIIQGYNIDFGGGPPLHYLIADRSGQATLVEFSQGEVKLLPNKVPWNAATNFLRSEAGEDSNGECWRYTKISKRLVERQGSLSSSDALQLLADVAVEDTQWSVVYQLKQGEVTVAMGGANDAAPDQIVTFPLK